MQVRHSLGVVDEYAGAVEVRLTGLFGPARCDGASCDDCDVGCDRPEGSPPIRLGFHSVGRWF